MCLLFPVGACTARLVHGLIMVCSMDCPQYADGPTFLPLFVSFLDNFQGNLLVTLFAPAQGLHARLVDLAFAA